MQMPMFSVLLSTAPGGPSSMQGTPTRPLIWIVIRSCVESFENSDAGALMATGVVGWKISCRSRCWCGSTKNTLSQSARRDGSGRSISTSASAVPVLNTLSVWTASVPSIVMPKSTVETFTTTCDDPPWPDIGIISRLFRRSKWSPQSTRSWTLIASESTGANLIHSGCLDLGAIVPRVGTIWNSFEGVRSRNAAGSSPSLTSISTLLLVLPRPMHPKRMSGSEATIMGAPDIADTPIFVTPMSDVCNVADAVIDRCGTIVTNETVTTCSCPPA